jgi:uncharacterized damage-inducible protein DinB
MGLTATFLTRQLEHTVPGPMWHGPALDELLADVTAAEARAHPIDGAHSIAELVAHLSAWTEICARRLAGDTGEATPAEDWPAADASSDDRWHGMVRTLRERYTHIARTTQGLTDETLDAMLPARTHAASDMLNGLVTHAAYHGGQIALLKKLVRS